MNMSVVGMLDDRQVKACVADEDALRHDVLHNALECQHYHLV